MNKLDLDKIETCLSRPICEAAIPKTVNDPIGVLNRWKYLSQQFPRFLGAILSRNSLPAAQCLVAKNITGECGSGQFDAMHSKLFAELVEPVVCSTRSSFCSTSLEAVIESNLVKLAAMSEGESIGFLIGLEAPAYEILDLLRRCLADVGMESSIVDSSIYMVTHQEVEAEHQQDSLLMAQVAAEIGCEEAEILRGGQHAVEFWNDWWAAQIQAQAS